MNRSERRALAREKSLKPKRNRSARRNVPMLHEIQQVFAPIDAFVDQLRKGEVLADSSGGVIFEDMEGAMYQAEPAILGFAEVWEQLANRFSLAIDTPTLYQLANRLKYNMPIDPLFVEQVQKSIDGIRAAYRTLDVHETKSIVRTQEIRIACEELGLTGSN